MELSCREAGARQLSGRVGSTGPLCTLGGRPSGAVLCVVVYSFPPLSGESSIFSLRER
jgi:hypothetical protein